MQKTLGGDRLGSGNKQKINLHGFERSTFDIGYVWRNTQAPGTLVPFMCNLALPGDSFDINLGADVKTHPTIGPLFGSFKLQLDVFECPIRLYNSWLHNNKLFVGLDMSQVKLPQLVLECNVLDWTEEAFTTLGALEQQQINQSSILAYLGLRGVGDAPGSEQVEAYKNAVPLIAYWDIVKNYYANKQEQIGAVIHSNEPDIKVPDVVLTGGVTYTGPANNILGTYLTGTVTAEFTVYDDAIEPTLMWLYYAPAGLNHPISKYGFNITSVTPGSLPNHWDCECEFTPDGPCMIMGIDVYERTIKNDLDKIAISTFDLSNIDTMRDNIMLHDNSAPFYIDNDTAEPYGWLFAKLQHPAAYGQINSVMNQEGLALKTYQSDIFQNWLNTEWIDGASGINEITRVDTSSDSFTIDALNLANKVYQMLTRIAVSGGSYDDWVEAVYDHTPFRKAETPMYHGGLSKEIIFQEVVSNTQSETDLGYKPLGALAGKGGMANKHKGGKVNIKISEPSFIIGIVSITPRVDYCQGNDFFMSHESLNDLHKPNLSQIGFQDLLTDRMAFWDTTHDSFLPTYKSAGKQPAWIDYQTNFNRLYGNFAIESNEMFMTLARRYEPDEENLTIKDLTTYIDPTKFNYAFAQTSLDAQNFWVQIGVDITARRKMSSKVMPNL